MIVVTTPTGNIGSKVVSHLLVADVPVRVIARDPSKLSATVRKRVEIITGSLEDEAVMEEALKGAESVFLVVPPSLTDNNDEAYYLRFTRPALKAIKSQGVKRVVDVSVLGRGSELSKKAGPVTASVAKDVEIEESGVDYRALWCPALMENMLSACRVSNTKGCSLRPAIRTSRCPRLRPKILLRWALSFC